MENMPPRAAPAAAGPASWPITVQLFPPDRLKALIYHHPMKSMVSGSMWCWTYISQGLTQLGQKEVVFTVRRRVATEREHDYDLEPLKWFKFLYSLAQEGKIVDNFQPTVFQAFLFLGRPDFTMILYCPLTNIDNVPRSYLPEEGLQAIPLTATEAEVAKHYGAMRPLSHLGISERWFPFPPWIDRDRKHCITMADMEGTVRGMLSFNSVLEVSVLQRGSDIVVHVPQRAEEYMKTALARLGPSLIFALDSFMYDGSDSGIVWKNEYTQPTEYSIGTFDSCSNLGFIVFCPEQERDEWQLEEDGYVFHLTTLTWMKIRRAIEESMPLTIPVENDFRFCLEYASRQTQSKRTTTANAHARAYSQRAPPGSIPHDSSSSLTPPSSKALPPNRYKPLRLVSRDSCKTCSLTRKFEANSTASSGKEGSQVLQSSVAPEARPIAPATRLEELQLDSKRGCDKCNLLYEGIKSHLPYCGGQETGVIYFSGNKTRLYCTLALKQGWSPVLEFVSCKCEFGRAAALESWGLLNLNVLLRTYKAEPCPWLVLEESSETFSITPSDEGVEHARHWLQACEDGHKSCVVGHLTTLPTRVLDLGTFVDGTEDLHLFESQGEIGSYCALSRCWDSSQSLKTTMATIGNHKAGIKFSKLPKTFQDAIVVCRRLKLRYLWIDSLCIIQDDDQDWQNEATKMAKIYVNSRLTIAVPGDGDCAEGCFMSTSPERHERKLRWPGVGGKGSYAMYVRHSFQHAPFYDADQSRAGFRVMNRAWVHQEQLLSPRVLYLSKTELIWKCKETCRCECGYGFLVASNGNTSVAASQEELIVAFRNLSS